MNKTQLLTRSILSDALIQLFGNGHDRFATWPGTEAFSSGALHDVWLSAASDAQAKGQRMMRIRGSTGFALRKAEWAGSADH